MAVAKKLGTTRLGLMELPNLGDILKYHGTDPPTDPPYPRTHTRVLTRRRGGGEWGAVIAGKVTSDMLKEGMEAETLAGKKLKFTLAGGAKVNGIKIKKADVNASNGVLHVVTEVIVPQ